MKSRYRKKTSLPKVKSKTDPPIWLNSFLSIFVPSCSVDIIDPGIINNIDNEIGVKTGEREKTVIFKGDIVQVDAFAFNKKFQRKVIRRQVICSSIIILLTVGTIWSLVTLDQDWKYSDNIFKNEDFNVSCCALAAMSILSITFFRNIDIFDIFWLNTNLNGRAKGKPIKKGLVVLVSSILLLRFVTVLIILIFASVMAVHC